MSAYAAINAKLTGMKRPNLKLFSMPPTSIDILMLGHRQ
jgi:hypothetical protein